MFHSVTADLFNAISYRAVVSAGDPSRRPYPTDSEMRQGLIAKNYDKLKESYINQNVHSNPPPGNAFNPPGIPVGLQHACPVFNTL